MAKMEEQFVVRAIDDGYGDLKAYNGVVNGEVNDGERLNHWEYFKRTGCLLMPSHVILDVGQRGFTGFDIDDKDPLSYVKVKYKGRRYLVGLGAVKQDDNAKWIGEENKHNHMFFPVLLATTLGLLAQTEKEMVDLLVMGLPVKAEKDASRHEQLRNLVIGKFHEVEITLADGTVLNRSVAVKELLVHRQPFGSLCHLMLGEDGSFRKRDLAKECTTIADIGTKTFNIYTLDRLENLEKLSDNTNDGMMESYRRINQDILENTGSEVPEGKLPEVVKLGKVDGFDLAESKEFHFELQAQIVCTELNKILTNSPSQINNIIWTGGGVEVLKQYIPTKIDKRLANKNIYYLGRFATVKGLRNFGMHKIMASQKKASKEVAPTKDDE